MAMTLPAEHGTTSIHLVVLQHGLWGTPDHLSRLFDYLSDALPKQCPQGERFEVRNCPFNRKELTYDGIDACGSRLAKYIQDTISELRGQGSQVTKLSLIGYSLGGLITRYAAGKLYVVGLFEEVTPVNMITIATPHLGSFKQPTSFWARFFNSQVPIIASRTGVQLLLADADYTVPWLAQQQALHNQAREQYEARHAHEQQGQGTQQAQQQQQGQGQEQHSANPEQRGESDSQQQQQETSRCATGNNNSSSCSNTHSNKTATIITTTSSSSSSRRQQRDSIPPPPGIDVNGPVPLLLLMAHPSGPFHGALAAFKTRICAANIKYDTTVPYCTAAMRISNPYDQHHPVPVDPERYPSVVRPAAEDEEVAAPSAKGRSRLFLFLVFLPLFPVFWAYSATYGILHHRRAVRQPLDRDWLQQYAQELAKPFSRQHSRQVSRQHSRQQPEQQQQQQQLEEEQGLAAAATLPPAAGQGVANDAAAALQEAADELAQEAAAAADAGGSGPAAAAATSSRAISLAGKSGLSTAACNNNAQQQQQKKDDPFSKDEQVLLHSPKATLLSPQLSSGVLEHQGIVEQPWVLHQQQQWMAQQLFDAMPACWVRADSSSSSTSASTGSGAEHGSAAAVDSAAAGDAARSGAAEEVLQFVSAEKFQDAAAGSNKPGGSSSSSGSWSQGGWHRVDVWGGHMHAHATIVVRDARYDRHSRDLFAYLANHMSL